MVAGNAELFPCDISIEWKIVTKMWILKIFWSNCRTVCVFALISWNLVVFERVFSVFCSFDMPAVCMNVYIAVWAV
jgi:hypothetical protein